MHDEFTPTARRFWDSLDEQTRMVIVNNVWCIACRDVRAIVKMRGELDGHDLVLRGECRTCGGEVARVVEPR